MSINSIKRDELQIFVREQIIGPGAFNKRFFFLKDWELYGFKDNLIKEPSVRGLDNHYEVLPTVPAYEYSSGILFPGVKQTLENENKEISNSERIDDEALINEIDDQVSDSENLISEDESTQQDTREELVSKQQNYPDSFGLTFVVDRHTYLNKDIHVTFNFRKYQLIDKKKSLERALSIHIPENEIEFERVVNAYLSQLFTVVKINQNYFLCIKKRPDKNDLCSFELEYVNTFIREEIISCIKGTFGEELIEDLSKPGIKFYRLSTNPDECFYSVVNSKKCGNQEFSNYYMLHVEKLVEHIKLQLQKDASSYIRYSELIKKVELYEQVKEKAQELIDIYRPRNANPIWECRSYFDLPVVLPSIVEEERISRFNGLTFLDNVPNDVAPAIADLRYSIQYLHYKEKTYIKIIISNSAVLSLGPNESARLNMKDVANKKAYFGVKLVVKESKVGQLLQYNPPQLLQFDEEEGFNKLLYRNFIDYGEGYNTSVNWARDQDGLLLLSTEFLPEQESPKIDFVPSKVEAGTIIPRLKNSDVLSMRGISTLSGMRDEVIIQLLKELVADYDLWIDERIDEKDKEEFDASEEELLLTKQLAACRNDSKRLLRNIHLLEDDKKAMAAFRTMNTAMFMQLVHGDKGNINTGGSSHEKYASLVLKDKEPRWRTFQLAFILLNIDAFVRPDSKDKTVSNVFTHPWPERNEIADLIWFPTGGGKTEAYLGIIAFTIAYRRFTETTQSGGTTVIMRYTLRLLTLQQFQRATLLICAMEVIRKENFPLPGANNLGTERITIGLFVGGDSLPNKWIADRDAGMRDLIHKISVQVGVNENIVTSLPFTECPWCHAPLFIAPKLGNFSHTNHGLQYGMKDKLSICCNNINCSFRGEGRMNRPTQDSSIPFLLFDEDIYKYPPTLLFGTVDKFASLANKVSNQTKDRNNDARRFFGKGTNIDNLPPWLIIQDELHLLMGPLGSAVGLFEKAVDELCTYQKDGISIRPKIITSTATTRNTNKQIFALFNRRSEVFPKPGILSDDSYFAVYERQKDDVVKYSSNRKYVGVLPIGKTQVWMQLRLASLALVHRTRFLKQRYSLDMIFNDPSVLNDLSTVMDNYHTVLSYFNSLKEVGKTQSQITHYLPGDVELVGRKTSAWSFLDKIIRQPRKIMDSELTGRLSGEEVKTNLSEINTKWAFFSIANGRPVLNSITTPEFIISTNMISVGIDVSRFNTMIISSMPRNIAEYIQASSRVARRDEGIVFTVHHPFRSRDISHYQRFKEFHEKFYSYVEPISVTPFAAKALDRYLPMYLATLIRHDEGLGLMNNDEADHLDFRKIDKIIEKVSLCVNDILSNANNLNRYLDERSEGFRSSVDGIISEESVTTLIEKTRHLLKIWHDRLAGAEPKQELVYSDSLPERALFFRTEDIEDNQHWKVGYSLREIAPSTVIKTVQQ
jgi:hypothetical protein